MSHPQPSQDTLAAVRRGNSDALAALIADWWPVVLSWCSRLGGPSVDPCDAAQDVLIVVMDRIGQVYAADRFRPWLFGVTRRVLARHRRQAWVKRWAGELSWEPVDGALREPDDDIETWQIARRVHRTLGSLSADHRQVLVLCDLEHRTDAEVAELLLVPVGTVKSRLHRARSAFRTAATRHGLGPLVDAATSAREGR